MKWSQPTYTGNITAEIARVRAWCNLTEDNTTGDDLLHEMILVAVGEIEKYQRRQLLSATYTAYLDDWPESGVIEIRDKLPITAISAVKYKADDGSGTLTTVTASNYHTSLASYHSPARIVPISTYTWPTLATGYVERVQVSLTAGYGSTESIPMTTRAALRYLVAQMVEVREPVVVGSISSEIPLTVRAAMDADCWGWYA